MFQPVGPQRPAVYWRRRVVLLLSVVVVLLLLVVVVRAMTAAGAGTPTAGATSSSAGADTRAAMRGSPRPAAPAGPRSTGSATPSAPATTVARATAAGTAAAGAAASGTRASGTAASGAAASGTAASGTAASGTPASGTPASAGSTAPPSSTAPPGPCAAGDLRIAAQAAQARFPAGSKPVLGLLVTDVGSKPCVQDFSDRQVLLRVYNGESRVWGSQDCAVPPGSQLRTLAVGRPVRVEMVWSGLSSQPGCGGPRQPAGAGTYTLYASLSGQDGTAATFTLS